MADTDNNDPGQGSGDSGNAGGGADAFWKEFDTHLDSWFAKKEKEAAAKRGPGTSRTSGTKGLPDFLAGLMGGPFTRQD